MVIGKKANRWQSVWTLAFALTSFLLVGCADKFDSSKLNGNNSSSSLSGEGSSLTNIDNNDSSGGNFGGGSFVSPSGVSVLASSNSEAQTNCSLSTASFSLEVLNVERGVTACMEYVLSVPMSSPRHGESSYCDSNNKFSSLSTNTQWQYDSANKKWSFMQSKVLSFIRGYVAPGMYRVVVKDTSGQVSYSSWVSFGNSGKADCRVASTTTTPKRYQWTAVVAGPVAPPTSPVCNSSNLNRTTNYNGYTWTCVYR